MLREILPASSLLMLPLTVLVTFFLVFTGAIVRAYATRGGAFDTIARMPIDDEEPAEKRS